MAGKKKNVWKITSIVFIVLFVLVLAAIFFRAYFLRPSFGTATPDQIAAAKSIALGDLTARGIDSTNLSIRAPNDLRPIMRGEGQRSIVEVTLYDASEKYQYIIDVNTKEILVYSMTDFFDGLDHSKDNLRGISPPRVFGI